MITYLTEDNFKYVGFSWIKTSLTSTEPAPDYASDPLGMAELRKVIEFARNDTYYSTFEEKAAYMICSIAGSQYFPNGNKRLAVTTLLLFLVANHAEVLVGDKKNYKEILKIIFPLYEWEENSTIDNPHTLFLYNLTIVIGDRAKWGVQELSDLRTMVSLIFRNIYKVQI